MTTTQLRPPGVQDFRMAIGGAAVDAGSGRTYESIGRALPGRVVHGHTVTDAPELRPHRIGVDTGAYASGRLSCAVIEGEKVVLLTA